MSYWTFRWQHHKEIKTQTLINGKATCTYKHACGEHSHNYIIDSASWALKSDIKERQTTDSRMIRFYYTKMNITKKNIICQWLLFSHLQRTSPLCVTLVRCAMPLAEAYPIALPATEIQQFRASLSFKPTLCSRLLRSTNVPTLLAVPYIPDHMAATPAAAAKGTAATVNNEATLTAAPPACHANMSIIW